MEIKKSWTRFLSIFLIVALGVAFFAGLRATDPDMRLTADAYFDNSGLLDIRVLGTWGLTEGEIDAIEAAEGVEEVEGVYSTHVVCDVEGNQLVVEVMSSTEKLNRITVSEGRMPENRNEVLVDSFFLSSSNYKLGDRITLSSGTEEELSSLLKEDSYTIVGVGSTPYYLSFQRGTTTIGSGDINSFIVVLPEVFAMEMYTGAYVTVSGAKELTAFTEDYNNHIEKTVNTLENVAEKQSQLRYDEFYQEMEKELLKSQVDIEPGAADLSALKMPKWYVLDRNTIEAYVEYEQNADRIGAIGKVFPAIFFLVAALISLTTMTRMVEEERTQIGTLKALGYHKHSIAMKYILYALLATLGGSLFGSAVGLKLLPMIIITAYKIMYINLPEVVAPFNLFYASLATGFAVLAVGFATFFACYKELRSKPSQLMRPEAPKTGKRVLLERVTFLWKHLSFSWKATLRNLFRYKKRFLMTVFGIGGCMALLLVGFGIKDSIFVIYTRQFDEIQLYQSSVSIDVNQKSGLIELEKTISDNPGIKDSIRVQESAVTIVHDESSEKVQLVVIDEPERISDFITFRSRRGHKPYELNENEIVITEQVANRMGVKAGDTLTIEEGETKVEVRVGAVVENYLNHFVYIAPKLYGQLFHKEIQYNAYYLSTPGLEEAREQEIGNALLQEPAVTGIYYVNYFRNLMDNMLVSLNIVVWVLIIAAGALAYIVLYNLNNININERRRELATIRVLGFHNNELAAYVYRENILLTVIGMIAGLGLGAILHRYIIETVEISIVMFGRNIDLSSYIFSAALTVLFSACVNFIMYFKLKKINMVESLKSVE